MPVQTRKQELTPGYIAALLDQELNVAKISDSALNGLQVEGHRPVRKLAVAVDASLATFLAAAQAQADMLLVHHGIFWSEVKPFTGPAYQRLRVLVETGLALYASHLPLDLHPRLGNNILLARGLGLQNLQSFGTYHGQTIGFGGQLQKPMPLDQVAAKLAKLTGVLPKLLPFGPAPARRMAVISGGGGDLAQAAAEAGYDTFITGEAAHHVYHPCREAGINLLLGGHYATETLGVKALAGWLKKKIGLETTFLDIPTGM